MHPLTVGHPTHHARLPVMHDGPLDLNTTNGGGGLENNGGTCGCGCEGFQFITNRGCISTRPHEALGLVKP